MNQTLTCRILDKQQANNFLRFLPSVICCLITVIIAFSTFMYKELWVYQLKAILSSGFYWLIVTKLYKESHNKSKQWYILTNMVGWAVIALYIQLYPNELTTISMFMGLFLTITIAPFMGKDDNQAMIPFVFKIFRSWLFTLSITILILLMLAVIYFSLNTLFNISLNPIFCTLTIAALLIIVTSVVFVLGIPCVDMIQNPSQQLNFVSIYLLIPVITVLGIILNAYAVECFINSNYQNLFQQTFLKRNLSILILIFTFTVFTYYLLTININSKLFSLYHRHFPKLVIIPLSLLCTEIYCALKDSLIKIDLSYYYLLLLSVWGIISALYSSIKYDKSPKFMILSLSILTIFAPIGYQITTSLDQVEIIPYRTFEQIMNAVTKGTK